MEKKLNKWQSKEARELFCKCVNSWIIKCGSERDPLIKEILPKAKEIIDFAFDNYWSEEEEGGESNPDFPTKTINV
jgi:hypothetical protein